MRPTEKNQLSENAPGHPGVALPEDQCAFSIGELSAMLALSSRTVRYYEEIGLLAIPRRAAGGRRVYSREDAKRLRFVQKLKLLGLSLQQITELNDIYKVRSSNAPMLRRLTEILNRRVDEIDERITQLSQLRVEVLGFRKRIEQKLVPHSDKGQTGG